jgi:hypothetical protein
MPGLTVVFVLEDGAVFEFMYWADGRQRFGA